MVLGNQNTLDLDTTTNGLVVQVGLLCSETSGAIQSTNHFAVDFRQNLCAENVGEFGFSIKTVNSLKVLSKFHRVGSSKSTGLGFYGYALNAEAHLVGA